jgi:hypothetical protein
MGASSGVRWSRWRSRPSGSCHNVAVRVCVAGAVVAWALVLSAPPLSGRDPDKEDVLKKAQEYLAAYEHQLAALVGDEHYTQRARKEDISSQNDHLFLPTVERRLDSEVGWVVMPSLGDTIAVREVQRIDGQAVAKSGRLRSLLEAPTVAVVQEVRAILDESASHNLEPELRRNINFSTFPLAYLRPANADRSKWKVRTRDKLVELQFSEEKDRALVRSADGRRYPAKGRFVLEPDSGRIHSCSLSLTEQHVSFGTVTDSTTTMTYEMSVEFVNDARLDVWVPGTMRDEAKLVSQNRRYIEGAVGVTGEATYDNYRRFETSGRVVSKP